MALLKFSGRVSGAAKIKWLRLVALLKFSGRVSSATSSAAKWRCKVAACEGALRQMSVVIRYLFMTCCYIVGIILDFGDIFHTL